MVSFEVHTLEFQIRVLSPQPKESTICNIFLLGALRPYVGKRCNDTQARTNPLSLTQLLGANE